MPTIPTARGTRFPLGSQALRTLALTAVVATAALWSGSNRGHAQAPATSPDVLTALLIEVRGLRAAMEQMASAGPRIQLALGRLQLQEQRVNTLVRRLDDVKTSLGQSQRTLEDITQRAVAVERMSREAPDAEERRQAEKDMKELKGEAARLALDVQRLQSEEAAVAGDVSAEQNRWSEINRRLEELERSLGGR